MKIAQPNMLQCVSITILHQQHLKKSKNKSFTLTTRKQMSKDMNQTTDCNFASSYKIA